MSTLSVPVQKQVKSPLENVLRALDFQIHAIKTLPETPAGPVYGPPASELGLSAPALDYLERSSQRLYSHQAEALGLFKQGKDVCLATGTGSGKTLFFHLAVFELLARQPHTTVFVFYPTKALARQQLERWHAVFEGQQIKVAKIDGDVSREDRLALLRNAQVVLTTPDVLHAWFLPNFSDIKKKPSIYAFFKRLGLVVIDEVHQFKGAFGSNSAYLFRRLQVAVAVTGNQNLRFITTSGTLNEPESFHHQLLNRSVQVVQQDGSPRQPITYYFVNPPTFDPAAISQLLHQLLNQTRLKFIMFVNSRREADQLPKLARLIALKESHQSTTKELLGEPQEQEPDSDPLESPPAGSTDSLETYKSGFRPEDYQHIMSGFTSGQTQGLVATSALEIGIDLPDLDLCIIRGMPPSNASLFQRVGRVGRTRPGQVLILNDDSFQSRWFFAHLDGFPDNLPIEIAPIYLENENLMMVQAECLKQEHEALSYDRFLAEHTPTLEALFPSDFIPYTVPENDKIDGRILESRPHSDYSLRGIGGRAYKLYRKLPSDMKPYYGEPLAELSTSQLIREGYPGAIISVHKVSYRIVGVNTKHRVLEAIKAGPYQSNRPIIIPANIFPTNSEDARWLYSRTGGLKICSAPLTIREHVAGYTENGKKHLYPITDRDAKFRYTKKLFTYQYASHGLLISHPVLMTRGIQLEFLAELFLKSLQLFYAIDSQDVASGSGDINKTFGYFEKGDWFLCIHDSGSYLNLTSHFENLELMFNALTNAQKLLTGQAGIGNLNLHQFRSLKNADDTIDSPIIGDETRSALNELCSALGAAVEAIRAGESHVSSPAPTSAQTSPQTHTLNVLCPNQEVWDALDERKLELLEVRFIASLKKPTTFYRRLFPKNVWRRMSRFR
jgi:DEAD/DEAH box helicase domain-containing protein